MVEWVRCGRYSQLVCTFSITRLPLGLITKQTSWVRRTRPGPSSEETKFPRFSGVHRLTRSYGTRDGEYVNKENGEE